MRVCGDGNGVGGEAQPWTARRAPRAHAGAPPGTLAAQVTAATFGADGSWLPRIVAQPPVISFVQVALLLVGAGISGITTWRLGKRVTPR